MTTKEDAKCDNKKDTEKTNRNLDLIQPTLDGSKHEHQLQKESLQWQQIRSSSKKPTKNSTCLSNQKKAKEGGGAAALSNEDPLSRYMRLLSNDTWKLELEKMGKNLESLKHKERKFQQQLLLNKNKSTISFEV